MWQSWFFGGKSWWSTAWGLAAMYLASFVLGGCGGAIRSVADMTNAFKNVEKASEAELDAMSAGALVLVEVEQIRKPLLTPIQGRRLATRDIRVEGQTVIAVREITYASKAADEFCALKGYLRSATLEDVGQFHGASAVLVCAASYGVCSHSLVLCTNVPLEVTRKVADRRAVLQLGELAGKSARDRAAAVPKWALESGTVGRRFSGWSYPLRRAGLELDFTVPYWFAETLSSEQILAFREHGAYRPIRSRENDLGSIANYVVFILQNIENEKQKLERWIQGLRSVREDPSCAKAESPLDRLCQVEFLSHKGNGLDLPYETVQFCINAPLVLSDVRALADSGESWVSTGDRQRWEAMAPLCSELLAWAQSQPDFVWHRNFPQPVFVPRHPQRSPSTTLCQRCEDRWVTERQAKEQLQKEMQEAEAEARRAFERKEREDAEAASAAAAAKAAAAARDRAAKEKADCLSKCLAKGQSQSICNAACK